LIGGFIGIGVGIPLGSRAQRTVLPDAITPDIIVRKEQRTASIEVRPVICILPENRRLVVPRDPRRMVPSNEQ
jgi:hypothetical protein